MTVALALSAAGSLSSCTGRVLGSETTGSDAGAADATPDRSAEAFAPELLEVSLEMDPDHWEELRHQVRTRHATFAGERCLDQPFDSPYGWFPADLTIDGDTVGRIGVRKKGLFGSQSTLKPSIKLRFDEYVPGTSWRSLDRLALNNSKQDPSFARTCLAYAVFRAAGVPAPRCTFARVGVNGQALGVYVAVEEIDEGFLGRAFSDPSGNLYEGTVSDFRPDFVGSFERENNKSDPDRGDLTAVLDALEATVGDEVEAGLEPLVNLDAFRRFWAVESLVWHRDGYSGNSNNFFVYADPGDGHRFRFLPWGTDGDFQIDTRPTVPDSVLAFGALAYRLYQTEAGRDRFHQELSRVIEEAWRPDELVAEAERIAALVRPWLREPAETADLDTESASVIATIAGRRDVIDAATAGGPPVWTEPMRPVPCRVPVAPFAATFSTTWGTLSGDPFAVGSGSISATLDDDGAALAPLDVGARSGVTDAALHRLQLFAALPAQRRLLVTVTFPESRFDEPFLTVGERALTTPPITVEVLEQNTAVTPPSTLRRFDVGEGTWRFDQVGTTPGAAVTGSFEGTLYRSATP